MKNNSHKTFIHVKAISEVLSVNALVPEDKAVNILTDIRDNFKLLKQKFNKPEDQLVVHTCVNNPRLL